MGGRVEGSRRVWGGGPAGSAFDLGCQTQLQAFLSCQLVTNCGTGGLKEAPSPITKRMCEATRTPLTRPAGANDSALHPVCLQALATAGRGVHRTGHFQMLATLRR